MKTNTLRILALLLALRQIASADEDRSTIFIDDFENRTVVGHNYVTSQGDDKSWSVADGVLTGKQTRPEHGAVIRKEHKFDDIDVQIDFRFNGGQSFNFVIDDKNEKSVHAGHICRVSVFQNSLRIGDDKTGSMNLKVRQQRQNKDLPAEEKKELDKRLDATQASASMSFKDGQWYTLRVHIAGSLMEAFIDGKLVTRLDSPGFDHPTKTKFGMTVNGGSFEFDNLKIFTN